MTLVWCSCEQRPPEPGSKLCALCLARGKTEEPRRLRPMPKGGVLVLAVMMGFISILFFFCVMLGWLLHAWWIQ